MLKRLIDFRCELVPADDLHPPRIANKNAEIDKACKWFRKVLEKEMRFGELVLNCNSGTSDYK